MCVGIPCLCVCVCARPESLLHCFELSVNSLHHWLSVLLQYQLPDPQDFDPGDGEVKVLNQSLPGYYSSMASMVNKIRQHKALLAKEYRRWIFEEMKRKNIGLCSRSEPGNMTIIASNNQCEFLLWVCWLSLGK